MFFRILLSDRRVWLTSLLAVFAIVVGRFSLPSGLAVKWVVHAGYWIVLLVFVLFATFLGGLISDYLRSFRFGRRQVAVLGLVMVTGGVLLSHERYGMKILADEMLLLGTSMDMHYERQVRYPIRATDIQGPFQVLQGVLDKRPFFYPFLVSLVHDLTGYRPENAFYLNTVLGFVFLGLVYLIGRQLGGSEWAGALLVLLFGGLPLLSQQMKGGGFDLLNLVMLAAILLLGIRYAERRDECSQNALIFAAVLLAFTRYESIIVLIPVAGLIVWGWWREERVMLGWPVMIAPLCLMFCLLQNRIFQLNAGAWELHSKGASVAFSWRYVADNLGHALGFFLDLTGYQPNSPYFAAIGMLSVPFFAVWVVRILRAPRHALPLDTATALVSVGLFAISTLLMFYFWGQFDHPVIRRLSLPVHLLMAVAIVVVVRTLIKGHRVWQTMCLGACIGLVVYSLPVMARRAYASTYTPAAEMEWRTDFLRRFPERDYLFLDNDSVFWITHHVAATPVIQARERQDGLIYHLRNDSFSAMFVMQHYRVDPETGERKLEPTDDLGPDFELVPVWERRIQTLFIGRISRITAIRRGGQVAARAGLAITAPTSMRTPEDAEAANKAFVDQWLKQLP